MLVEREGGEFMFIRTNQVERLRINNFDPSTNRDKDEFNPERESALKNCECYLP